MSFTSITTIGGSKLAIARWVYLVQDSSDVSRMGGISNNVYSTLTTAYSAATSLQTTLGGTNLVAIRVIGKFTGASGNITLSANWNPYIALIGDGPDVSLLGNIVLDNAAGSAYSFGTAATPVIVFNVRLGTSGVSCNATGVTGDGGEIAIHSNGSFLGIISSRVTNAANDTGSTGNIKVFDNYGNTQISTVSNCLSTPATTGNTGSLLLRAVGRMVVSGIENPGTEIQGVVNGDLTLTNIDFNTLVRFVGANVTISNCTGGSISIVSLVTSTILIENTKISDIIEISSDGTSALTIRDLIVNTEFSGSGSSLPNLIEGFKNVFIWNSFINNSQSILFPATDSGFYINSCEVILIRDSVITNIDNVDTQTGTALNVLQIDDSVLTSAKILHTSIMGGTLGLDSPGPISVDTFSTYIQQANGVNITINPL